MNDICLEYNRYKWLIQNADLLLFKSGYFPNIGWWIGKYTHSPYSHVALAAWDKDEVVCVEYREFKGGQEYPLKQYLEEGYEIDVFRPCPKIAVPVVLNQKTPFESYEEKILDNKIKDNIIKTARSSLNRKYGGSIILRLIQTYIPILRFRSIVFKDDCCSPRNNFVCSTFVSYAYRSNYIDPVPFLSDCYTTPGHLARSLLFNKMFQII